MSSSSASWFNTEFSNDDVIVLGERDMVLMKLFFLLLFNWLFFECFGAKLLDASVSCDQENFVLKLNFDVLFRGIVYSEDGFPNCVYVNGTILPQKTYELKVPLFGCETRINKESNYENAIIIQDNYHYLQSTDKKYLLTCIPAKYSTENNLREDSRQKDHLVTVDFGGVTIDSSHTTTEIIRATLPANAFLPSADLKYHVEIRAGHDLEAPVLTAPLNIGDPISYMVRLEKPVSDSQIGRCWASDSKSELELSDDKGCSLQPKGNIWGVFEKVDKNKEVVFINKIKAWAFPTSNEVNIFCNLRVCMSRSCTFTNCTENYKEKRSRRHYFSTFKSNAGLEEIETVKTRIRFRRNSLDTFKSSELITEEANIEPFLCLSMTHLVLMIACLFFLILLIALIIFLFCPKRFLKK